MVVVSTNDHNLINQSGCIGTKSFNERSFLGKVFIFPFNLAFIIAIHAGALLMCQQVTIQDTEIKKLCRVIYLGQQM